MTPHTWHCRRHEIVILVVIYLVDPEHVLKYTFIDVLNAAVDTVAARLELFNFLPNRPRAAGVDARAELFVLFILVVNRAGVLDILDLPLLLGPR